MKKAFHKIIIISAVIIVSFEILAYVFFIIATRLFFTEPSDITDVPASISISYTKNGKKPGALSENEEKPDLHWYETLEEALKDEELIRNLDMGGIDYKKDDAVELLQIQTDDQLAVFYSRAPEKGNVCRIIYVILEVKDGQFSQPIQMGTVGNRPGYYSVKGNSFYSYDCDDGAVFYMEQELVLGGTFGIGEDEIPVCFGMWDNEAEIRSLTIAGVSAEVIPIVAKEDTRYFWYFENLDWADRLSEVNWGNYTYGEIIDLLEIEYEPSDQK